MSVSRADRRLAPAALALVWALAGAATGLPAPAFAAADQGAPTPLLPTPLTPTSSADTPSSLAPALAPSLTPSLTPQAVPPAPPSGQPAPLSPDLRRPPAAQPAAVPGGPATPSPAGPGPRGDRIEVHDLSAPDANATGVYDEAHGGFGADMWSGTTLGTVQKVMPLLPAPTPWRSIARLERKLLLSVAAVPAGKSAGEPLIRLRADRLWAMGEVDGLAALLKGVPEQTLTPDLRARLIDAALVAGDIQTACQQGTILKSRVPDDLTAAKLQVFCQFSAGKANEAGLGVDLLREQKLADPAFFAAADALSGIAPGKLDGFSGATALTLAMARAAKLPLPEQAVTAGMPAPLLRAIASNPTATLEARLTAAERAEAVGAFDTEALRQLFEQVTFNPQEVSGPLSAAGTDKGVRSRALLFRAAEQQTQPAAKVEIISRALTLAGDGPSYFAAARLYAPQIAGLHPTPDLLPFAPMAVRSLLAAGRPDVASAWHGLLKGASDPAMAPVAAGLWPLLRLAGADASVPSQALSAWRKARVDLPPPVAERRILVGYGLLAAMGDKVPAEDWLALYDNPQPAAAGAAGPLRPMLWHGLRMAAEDLRLGESVLFSLATLGDGAFTQVDPTDLYRSVAVLRLIGLEGDARSLAVEAAIANGV